MRKCMSGVYKITNKRNWHSYIGSSIDICERWVTHRWYLNSNRSHNIALQNAWNKYGKESFEFSILLICDRENTTLYEQIYLDYYKPEYNIALFTDAPMRGKSFSEDHKRKIGEANSKHIMSEKQKEFLRQFHAGIPISSEQKIKMGESQKKAHERKSYGFLKGHDAWNKGVLMAKPISEETREKLRVSSTGRKHTEEAKIKIGLASVERGRQNKLKIQHLFDNNRA